MRTDKIAGRNVRAMADECSLKVKGCSLSRYDWRIICDNIEAAAGLLEVLTDACRYLQSVRKLAKAKAAARCREYVIESTLADCNSAAYTISVVTNSKGGCEMTMTVEKRRKIEQSQTDS